MKKQILEQIGIALAQRTQFFIREEDIQLYLANYLTNTHLYDNVFIEYHVPKNIVNNYLWSDINNIYIDIVIEKEGEFCPIEIKYKTARQVLPFNVFGNNVNVLLGQHGAQNIGCYDFWKDVKRIELFEESFEKVDRGIVLFVSNDNTYQNAPLNPNVGYAQFSIHNGRNIPANTFLNWNGNLSIANGRPGLTTVNSYYIKWIQMEISRHYYVLV